MEAIQCSITHLHQDPFRQLTLLTNHQHPTEKSKEPVHQCSDNKAQHLRIELQFGIDRSNIYSLSSVLRWVSLINEKCKCKGNFFILFMLWNTWKHICSFCCTFKKPIISLWLSLFSLSQQQKLINVLKTSELKPVHASLSLFGFDAWNSRSTVKLKGAKQCGCSPWANLLSSVRRKLNAFVIFVPVDLGYRNRGHCSSSQRK